MTEQDVINAFLAGTKAERAPLRTDGTRLCVGESSVAEWGSVRLVIETRSQGVAAERCKDLLTHAILLRMCRNQEVRRLLRRGCRDLLHAAMKTSSAGRRTPAGNSMSPSAEPSS